jgi:hypothetical protein
MNNTIGFPNASFLKPEIQSIVSEKPTKEQHQELIAICKKMLEQSHVSNIILNITHRMDDPDLCKTQKYLELIKKLWPWERDCRLNHLEKLTLATKLSLAGITGHLKFLHLELHHFLSNHTPKKLSEGDKTVIFSYLKLLTQYFQESNNQLLISKILSNQFLENNLNPPQLAILWNDYLTNILASSNEDVVPQGMKLLIRQLPRLISHSSQFESPIPSAIQMGLNVLIYFCDNKKNYQAFAQIQNDIFKSLPQPYYNLGLRKSNTSEQLDFSVVFDYISKLSDNNEFTDNGFEIACRVVCEILEDVVKMEPAVISSNLQGIKMCVLKFIQKVARRQSEHNKIVNKSMVDYLWKCVIEAEIFENTPFQGELHYFTATGLLSANCQYKNAELTQLYLSAIPLFCYGNRIDFAIRIALQIEMNHVSNKDHLVTILRNLLEANEKKPLEKLNEDLAVNSLLQLQKKWLNDQPSAIVHEIYQKHMKILLLVSNTFSVRSEPVLKDDNQISVLSPTAKIFADDFEEVMKYGIDKGYYNGNSQLYLSNVRQSSGFYKNVFEYDKSRNYLADLIKLAKAL